MEHEHLTCRGCGKTDDLSDWENPIDAFKYHHWVRHDAYGLYTGIYCDDCYENNYPYRKDEYYDPLYAGERMDDDY